MRYLYHLAATLLLTCSEAQAQNIWRVDQGAAGGQQNGSTWADAFTDLHAALQAAQQGDEIWVATGVYTPSPTGDRSASFVLKSGVKLLGGFSGTETSAAERDPVANPVRLSGNIGDPSSATDNSYHVLQGVGLDEHSLLDGFTVSDGYSRGSVDKELDQYGAGLLLLGSAELADSRPVISNCVFEHNQAGRDGGGVYVGFRDPSIFFGEEHLVNPRFTGCVFASNRSDGKGGGLLKSGPTAPNDTFLLEGCRFLDNYAFALDGGGVCFDLPGASAIAIRGCSFERNRSQGGEGGGFFVGLNGDGGYELGMALENCLFYQNNATSGAGFYINGALYMKPDIVLALRIEGCLFEENDARNAEGSAYAIFIDNNCRLSADIRGSRFLNNVGQTYFATSVICRSQSEASVLVENCEFIGNVDKDNPNSYFAAYNAGGHKVHSRLNNCLFAHNSGGAIFAGGDEQSQVLTEVTNCTFFRNGENPFGKRWYPHFNQPGVEYFNKMRFYNCAIWEPQSGHRLIFNNYHPIINGSWFFFDYCSLSPLIPGPAIIPNHSQVFGDSVYYGTYPAFLDTLVGDFRLSHCSPVMGRGSNEKTLEAGLAADYDGLPRIRFGRVDLGAYERQDPCGTSSTELLPVSGRLLLWPSPAAPGSAVRVSVPEGFGLGDARWQLWDGAGRLISAGKAGTAGPVVLAAPEVPGVYKVELQRGASSVWGRLVVGH